MNRQFLSITPTFTLVSFSNGMAYSLTRGDQSVFVQGDDADLFREDWMSIIVNFPRISIEERLTRLWSIYEDAAQYDFAKAA